MSDLKVLVGQKNILKIIEITDHGAYLDGSNEGDILLPKKYLLESHRIDDEIEVFVHLDSEDRLVATTETPKTQVGQFSCLNVVSIEKVGAFLDWGLSKDLFLPFREQTRTLKVGDAVVVATYLDSSGRLSASMRVQKFLSTWPHQYQAGQKVDLFIFAKTELGHKAIINGQHMGVLYANEVFEPLCHGQEVTGYIKNLRKDGKIDLILQPLGNLGAEDIAEKILSLLKKENGYLNLSDKTDPEKIYTLFGVSKKKFKIALGALYKKRLILIDEAGIHLLP